MSKLEALNDHVIRALECPSCMDALISPIYVCATGHSMCGNCWNKLRVCPICNADLLAMRNYALEAITELVYYSCDNKVFGCEELLTVNEIDAHAKICSHRKYACMLSPQSCFFEGNLEELQDHAYHKHPFYVAQGSCSVFVWHCSYSAERTNLMIAHGQMFYVHRLLTRRSMLWMVQLLGKPEENAQYTYTIQIRCGANSQRRLTIAEKVRDDFIEDPQEMMRNGTCAVAPLSLLNTYKANNTVRYSVHITKT